jgi:UrcA family protein
MMKRFSGTHCVRKAILTVIAVALTTSPLFAGSSTLIASAGNEKNTHGNPDLMTIEEQKRFYEKLKDKSRKTCGPTNVRATGSLRRAAANKECYEDTLAIAVLRLNDSAITALHQE